MQVTPQEILPDATADELRELLWLDWLHSWPEDQKRHHEFLQRKLNEIRIRDLMAECKRLQDAIEKNMNDREELRDNPEKWIESSDEWTLLQAKWSETMAKVDKLQGRK